MSTQSSLPVAQRIPTLDIVRGFALLGILIMNIPGFSTSFYAEADGSHLWPGRLDQLAEQARDLLFSGKFNSMFSLLFGIGFTIQFARLQERDPAHATGIYLRRLLVLGMFGLIHAAVFWTGDVLHIYAVLGLAFGAAFTVIFALNRVPGPSPIKLLGSVCYWSSRLALMLFYVLSIVRIAQTPAGARLLAPLGVCGRMPLTNYLMQTLLCTALFYGWGFGLWGRVGPAAGIGLALLLYFCIQVPWSMWWLRRHERGPLEALWARLTYGGAGASRPAPASPARGPAA